VIERQVKPFQYPEKSGRYSSALPVKENRSFGKKVRRQVPIKRKSTREAIKKSITDCGLEPLLIDEVEHTNFIPLEIQAKIKNSGYMIADLTTQNHGAYFEAGYAMGLNIPVIWCCKEDEKTKLHFDIRQYNNILWQNEEDLYIRLKKRLEAVIEKAN
jgi:nucleoside 2-deoxyribosyltransferase